MSRHSRAKRVAAFGHVSFDHSIEAGHPVRIYGGMRPSTTAPSRRSNADIK
jgi:hypothetical protein